MLTSRSNFRIMTKQHGAAAVEFGIIVMLLFTLLLGILEFARIFYIYNTVQEITRCAARAAAVSWRSDWGGIPQRCLFGSNVLVAGWEIQVANIRLRTLNLAGDPANPVTRDENISNCIEIPASADCIRFVEASVCVNNVDEICQPIQYRPMFGLIPLQVGIPVSTVRMPAESMGY